MSGTPHLLVDSLHPKHKSCAYLSHLLQIDSERCMLHDWHSTEQVLIAPAVQISHLTLLLGLAQAAVLWLG